MSPPIENHKLCNVTLGVVAAKIRALDGTAFSSINEATFYDLNKLQVDRGGPNFTGADRERMLKAPQDKLADYILSLKS